ncbi:hypothetical protein T484DRAFT_1854360 [Baffinella frigidus]|nr:hypothetical protein T484DRAFT_1854360 [Cryptophyta sp. CCMP2293]
MGMGAGRTGMRRQRERISILTALTVVCTAALFPASVPASPHAPPGWAVAREVAGISADTSAQAGVGRRAEAPWGLPPPHDWTEPPPSYDV